MTAWGPKSCFNLDLNDAVCYLDLVDYVALLVSKNQYLSRGAPKHAELLKREGVMDLPKDRQAGRTDGLIYRKTLFVLLKNLYNLIFTT